MILENTNTNGTVLVEYKYKLEASVKINNNTVWNELTYKNLLYVISDTCNTIGRYTNLQHSNINKSGNIHVYGIFLSPNPMK